MFCCCSDIIPFLNIVHFHGNNIHFETNTIHFDVSYFNSSFNYIHSYIVHSALINANPASTPIN